MNPGVHQALQGRSEALGAVLRALDSEPLAAAEIAERVYFGREAVRLALNRLLAQGAVERTAIPGLEGRGSYGWRLADAAAEPSSRSGI